MYGSRETEQFLGPSGPFGHSVSAYVGEESQTVRLKAQKADLGACRKFSDEISETGFQQKLSKLNLGSAFTFPDFFRESHFFGTL